MIACFDTNIYISLLTGTIPEQQVVSWRNQYIVRLCPVVYHELLRGAREQSVIHALRKRTKPLPVPTFAMWEEAAELLQEFVRRHGFGDRTIERLQNDVLIALTARSLGVLVITSDGHFAQIAAVRPFHFLLYASQPTAEMT